MVNAKRSGGKARFLPGEIGLDILQEVVALRFAGEALPWSGNVGIQDQRVREGAASLVAFAKELLNIDRSQGTCPGTRLYREHRELGKIWTFI